jgi:hypothetical protein
MCNANLASLYIRPIAVRAHRAMWGAMYSTVENRRDLGGFRPRSVTP